MVLSRRRWVCGALLTLAAGFGDPVDAAIPAPGRIAPTGGMGAPRAAHTATGLPGGGVLIAGGCVADSCEMGEASATAERYDPATGEFAPAGWMADQRSGHAAAALPDGSVLFLGGWTASGVTAAAERYDPKTGAFAPAAAMAMPRGGFTATPLADGSLLVAGGFDGRDILASAERYDPATGRFAATGPMAVPRGAHTATALADGRVLVAGGNDGAGGIHAGAEIYDPATGAFSSTGDMTIPRHKHAAAPLPDGRALILGGSDARDGRGQYATAEVFDPATGCFSPTGAMAARRFKLPDAVVALPNGGILVAGGGARVEVYDASTGTFAPGAGDLGTGRAFATATLLGDGRVLVAGGYDGGLRVTAGAWVYDPAA